MEAAQAKTLMWSLLVDQESTLWIILQVLRVVAMCYSTGVWLSVHIFSLKKNVDKKEPNQIENNTTPDYLVPDAQSSKLHKL